MTPMARNQIIGCALAIGVIALVVVNARSTGSREAGEGQPIAATDPNGGCLIATLGNQSPTFAGLVRERLRNPDSFEHVRTEAGPVSGGTFPVAMTYRGTNGFGTVDTKVATGEVRVVGCAARIITME